MKEIGSSFYLEDCVENSFSGMTIPLQLYKNHTEFFSSCRDALRVILNVEHISDGSIMVPPFTCHAVLQPFLERGLSIKPYSIKYDLSIDVENTIRIINHTKPIVFVYHTYFGFFDQGIDRIITVLRERNTIVIEDRTQNMFSKEGKEQADYVVGSIRKWLGIPDGGFLNTNKRIKTLPNNRFDSFVDASVKAMEMKYRYLRFGEGSDREYREKFANCEDMLDENHDVHSLSTETQRIIRGYDWNKLMTARKQNYSTLKKGFNDISQVLTIDQIYEPRAVPFMFPIYVKERRSELQSYLARNKIFATAIWKCPNQIVNQIGEIERKIYDEILCFAIDQRYDKSDMDRVVSCVNDYFRGI